MIQIGSVWRKKSRPETIAVVTNFVNSSQMVDYTVIDIDCECEWEIPPRKSLTVFVEMYEPVSPTAE